MRAGEPPSQLQVPSRPRSGQTNLCLQAGHLVPNLRTFQGKQPSFEAKPRLSFPKVMRGPLGRGAELASQLLLPQPGAERGGACGGGACGRRHTARGQHHGQSTLSSQIPAQLPLPAR